MELSIESGIVMSDGHKIPRMGFGTFQLEGEAQIHDAVNAALDAGYRLIDCARFYGNENHVGDALTSSDIPRDELFITSKVWNDRQIDGTVRESVEESLRDLQLDQLDLLLIHWPVEGHFVDTWKRFIQLQDEGLVRSIGVSNHTRRHLQALLDATGVAPVVDQLERHPYLRNEENVDYCKEHHIVFEAWSPLGRGECLQNSVIEAIAQAHGATTAQTILAWQLASDVVPLPRSKSAARIRSNARAASIDLTAEEIAQIDALDKGAHVTDGIDPESFNEHLNALSSHF